jgi:hypothetical protein
MAPWSPIAIIIIFKMSFWDEEEIDGEEDEKEESERCSRVLLLLLLFSKSPRFGLDQQEESFLF